MASILTQQKEFYEISTLRYMGKGKNPLTEYDKGV